MKRSADSLPVGALLLLLALAQACTWNTLEGGGEWSLVFDREGSGEAIVETRDGGFVIVGTIYRNTTFGYHDLWVVKLDAWGQVAWQKTFGEDLDDEGHGVFECSDGTLLIVGQISSWDRRSSYEGDVFVARLDERGEPLWQVLTRAPDDLISASVIEGIDGSIFLVGTQEDIGPYGAENLWVAKLGHEGDTIWHKLIGGQGTQLGHVAATACREGGIAVATLSIGVLRLDDEGNILWQKQRSLAAAGIVQTGDGGFAVAGVDTIVAAKLDGDGNPQWLKILVESTYDFEPAVTETADGGILVSHGFLLIKLGGDGTFLWQRIVGGLWGGGANAVAGASDGGIALTGSYGLGHELAAPWIFKLDASGWIVGGCDVVSESSYHVVDWEPRIEDAYNMITDKVIFFEPSQLTPLDGRAFGLFQCVQPY